MLGGNGFRDQSDQSGGRLGLYAQVRRRRVRVVWWTGNVQLLRNDPGRVRLHGRQCHEDDGKSRRDSGVSPGSSESIKAREGGTLFWGNIDLGRDSRR